MKGEGKERKMEREGEGKGNEGGVEGPPISCWHSPPPEGLIRHCIRSNRPTSELTRLFTKKKDKQE